MSKAVMLAVLMVTVTMLPFAHASDGDGDGITDSNDICPFASGSANSTNGLGCPDSDGDGLADFEQAVLSDWSDSGQYYIEKSTMSPKVHALTWSSNNSYFYAGSENNEVRIYDSKGYDKVLIRTMPEMSTTSKFHLTEVKSLLLQEMEDAVFLTQPMAV